MEYFTMNAPRFLLYLQRLQLVVVAANCLRVNQTLVSSPVAYTPVARRCLGIFQGPPLAGEISHIVMMAAVYMRASLRAKLLPLHMLDPPPGKGQHLSGEVAAAY